MGIAEVLQIQTAINIYHNSPGYGNKLLLFDIYYSGLPSAIISLHGDIEINGNFSYYLLVTIDLSRELNRYSICGSKYG